MSTSEEDGSELNPGSAGSRNVESGADVEGSKRGIRWAFRGRRTATATLDAADAPHTDDAPHADDDGSVDRPEHDVEPTPAAPLLSVSLALAAGVLAVLALAVGSPLAGAAGLVAVALLASALAVRSLRLCTAAAGGYVLAIAAGGVTGAGAGSLVTAAVCAVVAWDVADHGLELGRQVGREAPTARNELVHAVGSLGLATGAAAVAFGAFLAAGGGRPATALVFLLLGAVALLAGLGGEWRSR